MKISVFIITKNEEKNIEDCFRSVAWADEIVVVDSGSTDRTGEIVARYTDQFFLNNFTDYSSQKNLALSKTSGDWVLSLDADERVSDELRQEILKTASLPDAGEGYRIPRRSMIFGRFFRYTGTTDDKPIRFFKRNTGKFYQPIHETVTVSGRVKELNHPINHLTYSTIHDYLDRLNRYTTLEAEYFVQMKKTPQKSQLGLKSVAQFLRLYFWKQGFRDGLEGFLFSFLSAYYIFIKHAKHFEKSGELR